jgi:hypothetical protein
MNIEFSSREDKAFPKMLDLASPRPEYAQGKEKLNYTYKFSSGEVLSASEDDEGIARIVIIRDGKEIFDFGEFASVKFFTPSFYIKKEISIKKLQGREGGWANRARISEVLVGDMRDPKSILMLLHEIGHILEYRKREGKYRHEILVELWKQYNGPFTKKYKDIRREIAEELSKEEREASALGLSIARQVEKDTGINLLEGFEGLDDLQDYIYSALLHHKLIRSEEMVASDEGIVKDLWVKIKMMLKFNQGNYGQEQWEFLQGLFDKNRLKRNRIDEINQS